MRSHERIFVVLVLTFILFLIIFSNNLKIADDPLGTKLSPKPENFKTIVNLYFVQGDILKSEQREIVYDEAKMPNLIVNELLKGPKNLNYESIFQEGNYILKVEKSGKRCTVNLDDSFLTNSFWLKNRNELYIWSIVNTLTEIDDISEVKLLVEGREIEKKINTYNLNSPLVRIEEYIYSKKVFPSEVVVKFLDGLYSQRYDISYDLLSTKSKESLDFNTFSKAFTIYSNKISKFTKDLYLMQDFEDYYLVIVKYKKSEVSKELFYEKWKLVFEGSELKIDITEQIQDLKKGM